MTRTYVRDLEAFFYGPHLVPKESIWTQAFDYIVSSLISCGVVIAIYTPYMLGWVRLTPDQFVLWLVGLIPMSLLVSWPIIRITLWTKRRLLRHE